MTVEDIRVIENESEVFYVVKIKDNLFVNNAWESGGSDHIYQAQVRLNVKYAKRFTSKELAVKVANFMGGKVIKYTRTTLRTETIEETEGSNQND